ncbi:MAG: peptidoglycan DD-metalloendopeptidase family protein [Candidatus Caenarcaniphilales bacterium]|nr:peptidoglycan DD-metalloendopeptidase family protein [Candidatus Caenarcaniphilales bacterium]
MKQENHKSVGFIWANSCIKSLFFSFILASSLLSNISLSTTVQAKKTSLQSTDIALNSYNSRLSDLKSQKASIRQKVNLARKKEKLALARLQKTQRELFRVQSVFMVSQRSLEKTDAEIALAASEIEQIQTQIKVQLATLQIHLRHLYVYRTRLLSSLIDSLFEANSLGDFLTRVYYQKRLVSGEFNLIDTFQQKQKELHGRQAALIVKKRDLKNAIVESDKLKQLIFEKKQEQSELVGKIRKERVSYEMAERQLERESSELANKIRVLSGSGDAPISTGAYGFPVRAAITSPFGYRIHPVFRVRSFHSGIDLGAHFGVPVKSSSDGAVIYAGWYSGYGKTVIVAHGNNESTLYAHLQRISATNGQKVSQATVIGYVGATGLATGPHLHFEFRKNGEPRNPLSVIH